MGASTAVSSAQGTTSQGGRTNKNVTPVRDMISSRARTTKCMNLSREPEETNDRYFDRARKIALQSMYQTGVESGDNFVKAMELYPQEITGALYKNNNEFKQRRKDGTNTDIETIRSALKTENFSDIQDAISMAALNTTANRNTEHYLIKLLRMMEAEEVPYNDRLVNFTAEPKYNGGPGKGNVTLMSSFSNEHLSRPVTYGSSRISLPLDGEKPTLVKSNHRTTRQMETHPWSKKPPKRTKQQLGRAKTRFETRQESIDSQVYPDRVKASWSASDMDQMESSVVRDAQNTVLPSVSASTVVSRVDNPSTSFARDTRTTESATVADTVPESPSLWNRLTRLTSRFTGGSIIPSTLQTVA